MRYLVPALLLAFTAAPAAAQENASEPGAAQTSETAPVKKGAADALDVEKLIEALDKLFPPGPAPQPARLALARSTAAGVLPNGSYAAMFDELMSGFVDRVLAIDPGELGGKTANSGGGGTLRQQLAKDDPHFEERMAIIRRVVREELLKLSAVIEPTLRDGLARSIARRFDEPQLRDINAFLATPSGRAFGSQSMTMWMDADVLRSMVQSAPRMIEAMPGAMERIESETAHLPKPKKDAGPPPKD